MFRPSPELRHQVSTNTLQLTATNKCSEGHEKGESRNSVLGRRRLASNIYTLPVTRGTQRQVKRLHRTQCQVRKKCHRTRCSTANTRYRRKTQNRIQPRATTPAHQEQITRDPQHPSKRQYAKKEGKETCLHPS